ncbi:hypothetical protein LCGC14_1954340 [marine sediment metagenome]|uniref:Uncharacterized protein n=1 Tax=marine sediment metagenome TaxID=412755 RepID=A0A0F9FGS9_9ZZZZ
MLTCSCGRSYSLAQFKRLKLVGHQNDPPVVLEMRNCVCGSTRTLYVDDQGSYSDTHPEEFELLGDLDPWVDSDGPRREAKTDQEEWALEGVMTLYMLDQDGSHDDGAGPSRWDRDRVRYFAAWAARGFSDKQWKQLIVILEKYHRQIGKCPK